MVLKAMLLSAMLLTGCGDAEGYPHTDITPNPQGGSNGKSPCTEGTRAKCSIPLPSHRNTIECAAGETLCSMGKWGPCSPAPQ